MTVRIFAGDAAPWSELRRVLLLEPGVDEARPTEIESCRAYKDRLVLKLRGVDDASAAAGLRGYRVLAPADARPVLPEGRWLAARLVGCRVVDEGGRLLGRVRDLMPTAGVDLLVVDRQGGTPGAAGSELLVPMAREIVRSVDTDRGRIEVRLPDGLLELNAEAGRDEP